LSGIAGFADDELAGGLIADADAGVEAGSSTAALANATGFEKLEVNGVAGADEWVAGASWRPNE
jgi:hypothetical protein